MSGAKRARDDDDDDAMGVKRPRDGDGTAVRVAGVIVDALVAQRIVDAVCATRVPSSRVARNRRLARVRGVSRAFATVLPIIEPVSFKAMYGMVRAHALFANAEFAGPLRVRERFAAYTFKCAKFQCMLSSHLLNDKADRIVRDLPTMDAQSEYLHTVAPCAPCMVAARDAVRHLWHALFRAARPAWAFRRALQRLDEKVTSTSRIWGVLHRATDDELRACEARIFAHVHASDRTMRAWTESV